MHKDHAGAAKRALEAQAEALHHRLKEEEEQRETYRRAGKQALALADSLLQTVEQSLAGPDGGSLTARSGRPAPLPPITVGRPESAPNEP